MMKFSPYMILIGGVDDYTLNLNYACCSGNINSTTMDMTTAFKQRGAIAFGPKGNACNPCGPPDINKYQYLYAR